ncbi:MAG TPA: penicillin-binding protein 1B [Pseudomonadales bacterium]
MALRKRKSSNSRGKKSKARSNRRRWLPFLAALCLGGIAAGAAWFVWIDYQIRRDFDELQWALPARLYARPVELYAGAHLSAEDLVTYLQGLGYRETQQVAGPGEYQTRGAVVRLQTRGFEFWDGAEPSVFAEVGFSGSEVAYMNGRAGAEQLTLVRLEPVEIAQINPDTGEDRLPVALSDVPQDLIDAIIAVEDSRFYSHYGIDPIGIARAMVSNVKAGAIVQGGSTLTQQLIKNLYLNRERTLHRKIEEAGMALALDYRFDKDTILNAYINEVFLGQQGNRAIHGFALAAQHYFGRPLNELKLPELATLAGIARGASYYNPVRNPERATERRNVVLGRMRTLGYLTPEEFEGAREAPMVTSSKPLNRSGYPAFMELVYEDLRRDYDADALRTEGLRIFTTLDVIMQTKMEALLEKSVSGVERAREGKKLEAAVVITDVNSGEVRALAGSRQRGYTGFNRALKARRPIGSLVKPAVYLTALESQDFHLATVLADKPVSIRMQDGQIWRPENYEKTTEGDVYLYDALQRSLNLATVDLGMALGVDKSLNTLRRLGWRGEVAPYPSVLLGAIEMTPLEVTQIYQTLAANGFRSPLRAVEAVSTAQGTPLTWYGLRTEQAAEATPVFLLEHAMQGVFERGTAKSMNPRLSNHLPLAGKTGTTNDLRDSWFAGYGSDLVGVVWLGYDDNTPTGLTGATGALRVWTDVMESLDIQPRQPEEPPGIEWNQIPERAVADPADRNCRDTLALPFRADSMTDLDWSCTGVEGFFQSIFNRVRNKD